jgi:hypothetical protein
MWTGYLCITQHTGFWHYYGLLVLPCAGYWLAEWMLDKKKRISMRKIFKEIDKDL